MKMSTLTLSVPDDLAAAVSVLPPSDRAALDDALCSVVFAIAKTSNFSLNVGRLAVSALTNAPRSVSWEELTGFTDAEEEDFAANRGRYVPITCRVFLLEGAA